MADRVIDQSDAILQRLDKRFGKDAVYRVPTGVSSNLTTGANPITYTTTNVKVRHKSLSARELSELAAAGLTQIDAAWKMRKAYKDSVNAGDIITVSGFNYQVLDNGASLDVLELDWTILTRRRR